MVDSHNFIVVANEELAAEIMRFGKRLIEISTGLREGMTVDLDFTAKAALPVEVEQVKALDPAPMSNGGKIRHEYDICICSFNPRPEYSQDRADYAEKGEPVKALDPFTAIARDAFPNHNGGLRP